MRVLSDNPLDNSGVAQDNGMQKERMLQMAGVLVERTGLTVYIAHKDRHVREIPDAWISLLDDNGYSYTSHGYTVEVHLETKGKLADLKRLFRATRAWIITEDWQVVLSKITQELRGESVLGFPITHAEVDLDDRTIKVTVGKEDPLEAYVILVYTTKAGFTVQPGTFISRSPRIDVDWDSDRTSGILMRLEQMLRIELEARMPGEGLYLGSATAQRSAEQVMYSLHKAGIHALDDLGIEPVDHNSGVSLPKDDIFHLAHKALQERNLDYMDVLGDYVRRGKEDKKFLRAVNSLMDLGLRPQLKALAYKAGVADIRFDKIEDDNLRYIMDELEHTPWARYPVIMTAIEELQDVYTKAYQDYFGKKGTEPTVTVQATWYQGRSRQNGYPVEVTVNRKAQVIYRHPVTKKTEFDVMDTHYRTSGSAGTLVHHNTGEYTRGSWTISHEIVVAGREKEKLDAWLKQQGRQG